jgi:hypothetical protein
MTSEVPSEINERPVFRDIVVSRKLCAILAVLLWAVPSPAASGRATSPGKRGSAAYSRLPLGFEANQGQADAHVRFLSRGFDRTVFLTSETAILRRSGASSHSQVVIRFIGANPDSRSAGLDELPGESNYLVGREPSNWKTSIPNYALVKFQSIYPGIDLVYYGNQQNLEYDMVVAPGADPRRIRIAFEGARKLRVDSDGALFMETPAGPLRQRKPVVFQEWDGQRHMIGGRYALKGKREVVFRLGDYDKTRPLVIDPVLVYSTNAIGGDSIAVDPAGNIYVTGSTNLNDVPTTPDAFQKVGNGGTCGNPQSGQTWTCFDAFIAKLNPSGTTLLYSTFLGGTGSDGWSSIAVDAGGHAYVAGNTFSADFPTTPGAVKVAGGKNFVAKLNETGSGLIYSAIVDAGNGSESISIAVDPAGNAIVAGFSGGTRLVKLNAAGSALVYSRTLGGDNATAVSVDKDGNAYVAGTWYEWSGLPPATPTPGALERGADFVTKVDASGETQYTARFGGTRWYPIEDTDEPERVNSIAVDAVGNVYVTGYTDRTSDFPVTQGGFQGNPCSGLCFVRDIFIAKLNSTGSALLYSSRFDGGAGQAIALDSDSNVWVAGIAAAGPFSATPDALKRTDTCVLCTPGFLIGLSPDGAKLEYATLLDGASRVAMAVGANGEVSLTGFAGAGFSVTSDALLPDPDARTSYFVLKMGGLEPELSLDSTRYCTGDPWRLTLDRAAPNGWIRLAGTLNGAYWELPNWRQTDSNGHLIETGVFASGAEGNYTMYAASGEMVSSEVSLAIVKCELRISLDASQYCTGDSWTLKVSGNVPHAWLDLTGSTGGEPWNVPQWQQTGSDGSLTQVGVFVPGSDGSHTLSVRIGDLLSNTVSFTVSRCGP